MKSGDRFVVFLLLLFGIVALAFWLTTRLDGQATKSTGSANTSSCIDCHGKMRGLSEGHAGLNCTSCHLGNNREEAKDHAHAGMVRIPGNLADAGQTCGLCHAEAVDNINKSLMTTNSGIIAVDKYIFGEFYSPDSLTHIKEIHHSAADEHLRALCAKCHLGAEKTEFGPIDELSRGGGCNACHLNYTVAAGKQLAIYREAGDLPSDHPALSLTITDDHCFGCHSRSGRISTNYQGYHETLLTREEAVKDKGYKVLMDERVFKYIQADVHHERGLACIDCHGYEEVMGDGKTYRHEEEAVKITCEDCHAPTYPNTAKPANLGFAQQRIFTRREVGHDTTKILLTAKDSVAIINAWLDGEGKAHLTGKLSGKTYDLRAPAASCTREFGHQSVSCSACHTGWAPQCLGCHVRYEADAPGYDLLEKKPMSGSWIEYAGSFLAGPPTLGVRVNNNQRTVVPAIPGMIMTIDNSSFNGHPDVDSSFYRLFAPTAPHTTMARGRECSACHNNPVALGYGRGELTFDREADRWSFTPEYEALPADGLPADAWVGFLKEPAVKVSTRLNFRPFTVAEQQRMLTIGACLTCHDGESTEIHESLAMDFKDYLKLVSPYCKVPQFGN